MSVVKENGKSTFMLHDTAAIDKLLHLYMFTSPTTKVFLDSSKIQMWSCWKNFTGCKRRDDFKNFRFKVLHVAWSEPQRKRGEQVVHQWSTHSVKYWFSEVLIQWSYHSVKYSFSEVLIQLSTDSVKYPFSEILNQWSNQSVKYSFSEVLIQSSSRLHE